MVGVPTKAGLFDRQIPEFASNRLRAIAPRFYLRRHLLQSLALFVVLLTNALQLRAARRIAVRIGGDILNAKIGGGVESLHRGGKLLGLISIWQELSLQGQSHEANFSASSKFYPLKFSTEVNK